VEIKILFIDKLANTFYKKRQFEILNETFDSLNSTIVLLDLEKVENIDIDSRILNPSVFRSLVCLNISGFVSSISGNAILNIPFLQILRLERIHFRSLLHKNGITWIKEINNDFNVNLSNLKNFKNETNYNLSDFDFVFQILLDNNFILSSLEMKETFPVEDFCLYRDFPFNQLIFLIEVNFNFTEIDHNNLRDFCTFLWIIQYYDVKND